MMSSTDDAIRQKAAGYVGTLEQGGDKTVAKAVATSVAFDPQAEAVPWSGGALFIPALNWRADNGDVAKSLVRHLLAWHVWCQQKRQVEEVKKINIVLGSTSLAGAAGYAPLGQSGITSEQWLVAWRKAVGEDQVAKLLAPQNLKLEGDRLVALKR